MHNKHFKNLIIEISKSFKETLEESIGTLQLNKDESVLINTILNELDSQIYIGNKVSYYDYKDINQISPYDTLYVLSYDIDKFNKKYGFIQKSWSVPIYALYMAHAFFSAK